MPKKKKWNSGRSNLIKITLLFLLAAAAIIAVRFGNFQPRFILPEERALLEERRASPDNAYPILLEAARLLPESRFTPVRIRSTGRRGRQVSFTQDSIGKLLHIERPDDDPELIDLVHRAVPALEKAREVLDKPFLVFEKLAPNERGDVVARCSNLARHFLARARIAAYIDNEPELAAALLLEALQVARLIAQDDTYGWHIERIALKQVRLFARGITSNASLNLVADSLTVIGPPLSDPEAPIMMFWRDIDRTLETENYPRMDPFSARFMYWRMQKHVDEIMARKEEVYQLTKKPFAEIGPRPTRPLDDKFRAEINILRNAAELNAEYQATTLVLALERYNADNKTYAQQLTDLSPKYIKEIPQDPITDDSFIYRRTDTDYLLYSQGENGKDDNGTPNQDIVYVGEKRN